MNGEETAAQTTVVEMRPSPFRQFKVPATIW